MAEHRARPFLFNLPPWKTFSKVQRGADRRGFCTWKRPTSKFWASWYSRILFFTKCVSKIFYLTLNPFRGFLIRKKKKGVHEINNFCVRFMNLSYFLTGIKGNLKVKVSDLNKFQKNAFCMDYFITLKIKEYNFFCCFSIN